ncbi:MAG TPA: hypothetical protein VE198_01690 [Actinoallomurus sp.]|nr:hypothetical protein [Actinoallomurus sp.]
MRGGRNKVVPAIVAAALAGTAGVAAADPPPKPSAHGVAGKGNAATRHGVGRNGHRHLRPRTVVRCQNDDTEQLDEFDSDNDEPLHIVSPDTAAPAGGRCPGIRDALGIADILAGGHRTRARGQGRAPARR